MKSYLKISAIVFWLAVFGITLCHATTIHVPAGQPTIQAGINVAANGDTVLVAPGVYQEMIDYLGKAICIRSEMGPDSTVLTYGSYLGSSPLITFMNGEDTTSILDGFTLQEIFYENGIIRIDGEETGAKIIGCHFYNNTNYASDCGCIRMYYGSGVIVESCYFESNYGSPVHINCGNNRITGNYFIGNTAAGETGGAIAAGGNICRSHSIIKYNIIIGNSAPNKGGGIFLSDNNASVVANNTILNNVSPDGGGICIWSSCTDIVIENNIIGQNTTFGIYKHQYSSVINDCNDIFDNTPDNYSDAIYPGDNTISSDPLFCDTVNGNYQLWINSPCHPDSSVCGLIGALGIGCGQPEIIDLGIADENMANVVENTPQFCWKYDCALGNPEDSFAIAVGSDDDWQYAEMWNPASFPGPDTSVTYAGAALVDGHTYYLRLRVHNGLAWSDWYEMSFRMNSKPSIPVALSPIGDAIVGDAQPMLFVQNSIDAEGDPLAYIYHIYDSDYGLELATSDFVTQQTDSTGWNVDIVLADNTKYVWTAEATDSYESSDIAEFASFWVNTTEQFPATFDLIWPPDTGWSQVYDFPTTFQWQVSSDPDPFDSVYYRLKIATDSDFTFTAMYDSLYQSTYAVPSLEYGRQYWWKVSAIDTKGNTMPSSGVADFMTWILGDANADFTVNIGDGVFLINYIFKGGAAPYPLKAGDTNADCAVNIGDAVYLIEYIFKSGPPPGIGCAE